MIPVGRLKPIVGFLFSLCVGFYLGGRYVGALAKPTGVFTQPEWIATAQSTMWAVLLMGVLCAILWIGIDYVEHQA